jgi:hypothetical protein
VFRANRSLNQSTASSNISSAECAVLRFKVLSKAEIRLAWRRIWQGSRVVVVVLSEKKRVRQVIPVMPCEAWQRDGGRCIYRGWKSLTPPTSEVFNLFSIRANRAKAKWPQQHDAGSNSRPRLQAGLWFDRGICIAERHDKPMQIHFTGQSGAL